MTAKKNIAREVAVTGALAGTLNDFSTAINRAADYAKLFTKQMPDGAPGIDRFCAAMERANESLKQFCHELFKDGGPIDFADRAAWELVTSECPKENSYYEVNPSDPEGRRVPPASGKGTTWYRLQSDELPVVLAPAGEPPAEPLGQPAGGMTYLELSEEVANAVSYLEWRRRLIRHPNNSNLVAAIPGTEVTHG